MRSTDDYPLPEAYRRLMAAQRSPTRQELEEIEAQEKREALQARFRRRMPKVY